MSERFQDTFVVFWLPLNISLIRYDYDGISLVDWSTASRLQTDLATLDSRSAEPKIDNLGLSARRACR
jgi:hypothetical protein